MTDHQLNHALALEVMSWTLIQVRLHHGPPVSMWSVDGKPARGNWERSLPSQWNPAGDWGCVGEVLERVPLALIPVKDKWLALNVDAVTYATFDDLTHPAVVVVGKKGSQLDFQESPQRALSLAALAAVRGERRTTNAR